MYYVFTTEMDIAWLWLLVAGILWVMCWSGRKANGQQGMLICRELCEHEYVTHWRTTQQIHKYWRWSYWQQ